MVRWGMWGLGAVVVMMGMERVRGRKMCLSQGDEEGTDAQTEVACGLSKVEKPCCYLWRRKHDAWQKRGCVDCTKLLDHYALDKTTDIEENKWLCMELGFNEFHDVRNNQATFCGCNGDRCNKAGPEEGDLDSRNNVAPAENLVDCGEKARRDRGGRGGPGFVNMNTGRCCRFTYRSTSYISIYGRPKCPNATKAWDQGKTFHCYSSDEKGDAAGSGYVTCVCDPRRHGDACNTKKICAADVLPDQAKLIKDFPPPLPESPCPETTTSIPDSPLASHSAHLSPLPHLLISLYLR